MSATPCWKCDFPTVPGETMCPKCKAPTGETRFEPRGKWIQCARCEYMNPPHHVANCLRCNGSLERIGYPLTDEVIEIPDTCPDLRRLTELNWAAHRDCDRRDHGRHIK